MRGKYLRIKNADGKEWFLDEKSLKTGFCIYQPSSVKGKLLKQFLPVLNPIPVVGGIVRRVLKIEKTDYALNDKLYELFENIFSEDKRELSFAIFGGTVGTHQKMTIQISEGKKLLGYCKITQNAEIKKLFYHEKEILDYLKEKGVGDVPECLYCGELYDGNSVFVQSTRKSLKSVVRNDINEYLVSFVNSMSGKTRVNANFEETDFYKGLEKLKGNMGIVGDIFGEKAKSGLDAAIERVEAYYGNCMEYSLCHRDLTPWNLFYDDGIFVFDFEYAQRLYPEGFDLMHFIAQVGVFEKGLDAEALLREIENSDVLSQMGQDTLLVFAAYCTDFISLYVEREKEAMPPEARYAVGIRLECIEKILNR